MLIANFNKETTAQRLPVQKHKLQQIKADERIKRVYKKDERHKRDQGHSVINVGRVVVKALVVPVSS
jgi:hypothetical protein